MISWCLNSSISNPGNWMTAIQSCSDGFWTWNAIVYIRWHANFVLQLMVKCWYTQPHDQQQLSEIVSNTKNRVLFDKSLYMLMPCKITGHYLSKVVKKIVNAILSANACFKSGWLHKNANLNILDICLCGLVVRVPGYKSRGAGSIPGATRFSEK
jgi:hypothetical protein